MVGANFSSEKDFAVVIEHYRRRVDAALEVVMPQAGQHPARLHQAMRYAVLNGGKRIRPLLVYATADAVGANLDCADRVACALELIHSYSLVHDDLPSMDDDDLRRGLPTCHIAFDEATAILVGDALQTLAFCVLARDSELPTQLSAELRLRIIDLIGHAAGSKGMVGGQAIDLAATGREIQIVELEDMHIHKTGALIRASVLCGAHCSSSLDPTHLRGLDRYAKCIGLAFQIRDDVLDVEGPTAILGKPQGSDRALGKPTFATMLGLDAAKNRCAELYDEALTSLTPLGAKSSGLAWLADYIVNRDR